MIYKTEKDKIVLEIPAGNSGKYRFKTRESNLNFGEIFSTRKNNFNEKVYLEWQIGYDTTVSDVEKGKKETKLSEMSFVGSNGKIKYPYELSELLFEAIKINLISKSVINNLIKDISSYNEFIDDKKIEVQHNSKITLNGISFEETSIKLPTLFMVETKDNTQIEISIQKQQYASGVQPMVYFCIPILSFLNCDDLLGRPSVSKDKLIYVLEKNNIKVLFDIMKIFAMASKRHNYDVIEILKVLLKQV